LKQHLDVCLFCLQLSEKQLAFAVKKRVREAQRIEKEEQEAARRWAAALSAFPLLSSAFQSTQPIKTLETAGLLFVAVSRQQSTAGWAGWGAGRARRRRRRRRRRTGTRTLTSARGSLRLSGSGRPLSRRRARAKHVMLVSPPT
jgi:hypothetical protein